jgi:hypothetical protein
VLQGGWLCSQLQCDVAPPGDNQLTPARNSADWYAVGRATAVAQQVRLFGTKTRWWLFVLHVTTSIWRHCEQFG